MSAKKKKLKQALIVGLHARVPEQLYGEIEDAALKESRTFSNMVRLLLEEALARRKGHRT